jgi:hypothetical protein
MPLVQIHHQFRDGTTQMCAQREVAGQDELRQFVQDTVKSHPLPEGASYLYFPEDSPRFWRTKAEDWLVTS